MPQHAHATVETPAPNINVFIRLLRTIAATRITFISMTKNKRKALAFLNHGQMKEQS